MCQEGHFRPVNLYLRTQGTERPCHSVWECCPVALHQLPILTLPPKVGSVSKGSSLTTRHHKDEPPLPFP